MNRRINTLVALVALASLSCAYAEQPKGPSIAQDLKLFFQTAQETFHEWTESFRQLRQEAQEEFAPMIETMKTHIDTMVDHVRSKDTEERPSISDDHVISPRTANVDLVVATEEITAVVAKEEPRRDSSVVSWIRNNPLKTGSLAAITLGGIYATVKLVSHIATRQRAEKA